MKTTRSPRAVSRRQVLASAGAVTATLFAGAPWVSRAAGSRMPDDLAGKIETTPFIDTHEHLVEEDQRTRWTPSGRLPCDDWALLFSHYLNSDLLVAGMPEADYRRFVSPDVSPGDKWSLLEPWWPAVRQTGYGQAVRIALDRLYGVSELTARTVSKVAEGYRRLVHPGFYETVLRQHARIESAQVNSLEAPFTESRQPLLLMQDLSLLAFGVHGGGNWTRMTDGEGRKAADLAGWHRVIDHHFEKYGPYAVAVKTQTAYQRRLDFEDVPAERAAPLFQKLLGGDPIPPQDRKAVDDHLFWYCVRRATERSLPVKLHTGYYAGQNGMPLDWVSQNPADVADLLRRAPDTTFVLMHIGYPYQEAMVSLAKHYRNAVIDMCWAWIINPVASERFLRDVLVAAPANKVLTFGGDYIPVEPVVGHAALARRGLHRALAGLVADGWIGRTEAVDLVDRLMHGNARQIFRLEEKQRALRSAPWMA